MEDDNTTSVIPKNLDSKQKHHQDVLSAEDFAWADSCLIEDPEISETNMDSLKEALLDILDQHSEIFGPSNDIIDPENLPLVVEEGTSNTAGTSIDDHLEKETLDVLFSLKQPFLPNYNDEMMNFQYSDDDDDDDAGFVFSKFGTESPSEGIFKVWDLDIPVEEDDELFKQLKEALSSNAATRVKGGLKMETLDSLVESIADLSLK